MSSSNASVRIGIATVLSSIVSIAGTSIGPSLLGTSSFHFLVFVAFFGFHRILF